MRSKIKKFLYDFLKKTLLSSEKSKDRWNIILNQFKRYLHFPVSDIKLRIDFVIYGPNHFINDNFNIYNHTINEFYFNRGYKG